MSARRSIAEGATMMLGARNVLEGKVASVARRATAAHVKTDIGGAVLVALITNEAVADLKPKKGNGALPSRRPM
jgi:molybdopterin-binding protein